MQTHGLKERVKDIFTCSNPASVGVVQLHNKDGVGDGLQANEESQHQDGRRQSYVMDHQPDHGRKENRKTWGYIKLHSHTDQSLTLKRMAIDRNRHPVQIQGRIVAKSGGSEEDYGIFVWERRQL